MKKCMKKITGAVAATAAIAVLAVTAFATDYVQAPTFSNTPSQLVSVTTSELNDAIENAGEKTACVEVKSTNSLSLSSSVLKTLNKNEDSVLKIISPKAEISIDALTIKKVRKVDLSMRVYSSEKITVLKMKSKKDFGCTIEIAVTSCKLSAEQLAKAHVYCDNEDLGPVEVNESGVPVITVTKGGTYTIK